MTNDLLVVPAGGKLGLAGRTDAVPVSAAAARFAVEKVLGAFGSDTEPI